MSRIKNSCLDIKERFPCREKVINDLERRLANIRWPFMLINGAHSTGKSSITRALLESLNMPFSWNNCLEISSLKNLQIKILYDIGYLLNPKDLDEEELPTRVASNETFIEEFRTNIEGLMAKLAKSQVKKTPNGKRSRSIASPPTPTVDRFFIVLDNYDKLVDSNISILPALNEIHEKLKKDISVITIMISTIYYDRLVNNFSSIPRPLNFTFPGFDAKSFPTVLNKFVSEERDDTYESHCEHVTQTLSFSISDLNKLSFICEQSFLDQIDQMGGTSEVAKLRKFFTDKADFYAHKAITLQNQANPKNSTSSKAQANCNELEQLPKSAKYLLLAAFLASNNTKASDKKLFVIASDKRKVARNASRKETVITGPKLFTLERLIHIYEALVYLNEDKEELKSNMLNRPTNQLLSQIETLVSLKLLIKVNSVTIISLSSLIKYQISDFVTIEFIDSLATTLGINLREYMC